MKVVVVGGGFAGVKAALTLGRDNRFSITLISDRPNFEYHAALYRSATGRSPLEVAIPLKSIFKGIKNVRVVVDRAEQIDKVKRTVSCKSGETMEYDELILAPGVVDADFGIKGLKKHAYGIKTIDEAMRLKKHLHQELTAGREPDLNYVVVGAGPTGVELAGELVSYLSVLRRRHKVAQEFQVSLIEAAPRILPNLPVAFSKRIERRLVKLGIKIYTSTSVKGATASALQLPEGSIKTHTVVWTAGTANNPLLNEVQIKKNKLQTTENIWVAGDSANTERSGWASTAIYDGEFIAQTLKRRILKEDPLEYDPPTLLNAIPVGPGWCAVHFKSRNLFGSTGWVVRRWSDLRLYKNVLPGRLAVKTWLMGNKLEEDCRICRKALR